MAPAINPGPSLRELREKVWVNKLSITQGRYTPQVGDIIVFKSPKHGSRIACKRVVGVENDLIQPSKGQRTPEVIKKHHVWVESDNARTQGRDSNEYGQLHVGLIFGTVERFIWPRMLQKIPGRLVPLEFEGSEEQTVLPNMPIPPGL